MRMCLDGLVTYPGTKDLKQKGRNMPGVFVILQEVVARHISLCCSIDTL